MSIFGPPNVEQLKAKRDVSGLIKALTYQKSEQVRVDAAKALGELKDTHAVEPLIAATLKHPNPYVLNLNTRKAAINALGEIGDARAVEPLITALQNLILRDEAAESLRKIGGTRAVELLVAALEDDNNYVQEIAAETLGKIGPTETTGITFPYGCPTCAFKDKINFISIIAKGSYTCPKCKTFWKIEKGSERNKRIPIYKGKESTFFWVAELANPRIYSEIEDHGSCGSVLALYTYNIDNNVTSKSNYDLSETHVFCMKCGYSHYSSRDGR
jgi:hypothetical protein